MYFYSAYQDLPLPFFTLVDRFSLNLNCVALFVSSFFNLLMPLRKARLFFICEVDCDLSVDADIAHFSS